MIEIETEELINLAPKVTKTTFIKMICKKYRARVEEVEFIFKVLKLKTPSKNILTKEQIINY